MSEGEMTIVHRENDEQTARIVVGFLEANGIEAKISEDDAGDQLPSLETIRGVQIHVPVEQAEQALALLAEKDGSKDDSEE